jgi:hypothetical protein
MNTGTAHRWTDRLASPRAAVFSVLLGTFLAIPAVGPHLALDDFILGLVARGAPEVPGLRQGSLDLFTFTTGDPADNRALMDGGIMLPWWTDPELRIAFFRPLASLTHQLDFALFPNIPAAMHAHSLLWFAVALGSVAWLYRRLETSPLVAGLAGLLYALDDAHGPVVGWLSNRNALIATALGAAVIALYDVGQREGRRTARLASPALLGISLFAGEFAVGALAYVVAHAVFLSRGSWGRRALSVTPHLAVVLVWRWGWGRAGFGARGSGAYLDPVSDPGAFLLELPVRILALLHGAWSGPPSDLFFLAPPAHRPILVALATLTVVLVLLLVAPLLHSDAHARFWAGGMIVAILPVSASFPSDRLLLFVGVGAMALMSRLVLRVLTSAEPARWRRWLTLAFAAVHLVVAPLVLPMRAAQMQILGSLSMRAQASLDAALAGGPHTLVIASAPVALLGSYLQAERAYLGRPRPEHLYVLSTASSATHVERAGTSELRIEAERGFLHTPLERHYRGSTAGLEPGQRVELARMTAHVEEGGAEGRPSSVRFTFDEDLDGSGTVVLRWAGDHYEPLILPVGAQVTLPEEDIGRLLLTHALGLAALRP